MYLQKSLLQNCNNVYIRCNIIASIICNILFLSKCTSIIHIISHSKILFSWRSSNNISLVFTYIFSTNAMVHQILEYLIIGFGRGACYCIECASETPQKCLGRASDHTTNTRALSNPITDAIATG